MAQVFHRLQHSRTTDLLFGTHGFGDVNDCGTLRFSHNLQETRQDAIRQSSFWVKDDILRKEKERERERDTERELMSDAIQYTLLSGKVGTHETTFRASRSRQ